MTAEPTNKRRLAGASVRSYATHFERDEDPISEGGLWTNGRTDGLDWADVVTGRGVAHGGRTRMAVAERRPEQGILSAGGPAAEAVGDYDDPTALLTGSWGRNQHAKARVFSRNQTEEYFQEVELRLRSTMAAHNCSGYEVFWRCLKSENAYSEIVRWNGPAGAFTSLARRQGPEYGVKDGDVVEATIVGDVITSYVNGVVVLTASDGAFTAGKPGIGFNFGCGDTYVDHGLMDCEVDSADD
jgi:hypothetical protein